MEGNGSAVHDPESTTVDSVELHGDIGADQSLADVRVSTTITRSVSIPMDLDLNVSTSEIEMTVGGVDCLVDQRAVEGAVVGEVEVPQEVMSAVLGGDTPVGGDLPPTSIPEIVTEPGDIEMEDLGATDDSGGEERGSGALQRESTHTEEARVERIVSDVPLSRVFNSLRVSASLYHTARV